MKKAEQVQQKKIVAKKIDHGEHLKGLFFWLAPVAVILFTLLMTIGQNPDFLWKLQDMDLFALNEQFLLDNLQRVGGLSMYVGSFLNQFFFYPLVGLLIFLTLSLLVGILTAKTFKLKGWMSPLAYIPSLALLLCMTELGYMIYFIKVNGYVFNNILGILFLLVGMWAFKKIGKTSLATLFTIGYLLIGYPLCGVFALSGAFLMLLATLKHLLETKQTSSLYYALAIVAALIVIPIFYYRFVFDQIAFGDIYMADLPYFTFKGGEGKLWIPFLAMAAFFLVILWLKPEKMIAKRTIWIKILPVSIFFAFMALVYLLSFKDQNFQTEISMLKAADQEKWNEILRIAGKQKEEPSRLIVMTTNLALNKLGMAGDKMYHYKNGDKNINSPRFIVPIHIAGPLFYYQYGVPTYCTKWCMEGLVEYGSNVSFLKYSVLGALLNGEMALAQKYNDVLLSTLFHKSWALNYQKYIDHPEAMKNSADFQSLLPLTAFDDDLNEDYYNLESFLRIHFSSMTEVPKELTELSVLFNMEIKDDKKFWPRLFRWVKLNPTKKIPVHFQEAALLFAHLTNMDISGAPFDSQVMAEFKTFLEMVQKYGNYPEATMKELFAPEFSKTYWYYYFFIKGPQSDSKDHNESKN